jgi:hypothetical protein
MTAENALRRYARLRATFDCPLPVRSVESIALSVSFPNERTL